ncbi:MAG: hypothetical protein RI894_2348 [Bacteroidota bacterium]|jgi:hypothetical protein
MWFKKNLCGFKKLMWFKNKLKKVKRSVSAKNS